MGNKNTALSTENTGFFKDMLFRLKLIWRLMGDKRVSPLLKLLPIGALIYLISPIDLLSGAVLPVIGALDDAAALWLGATLFVALCPEDVVEEHTNALQKVISANWRDAPRENANDRAITEVHEADRDEK
jgi:uncharacterized membrane protein YkvA (DUF1232 family)